ncbi:hypothetical protein ACFXJ8_40170 [Nonomuraea sp. NPDC059194]|uniref:hypothetical protein n=1 Tax=Nonomuraea sp. NPDC059194 TaxID=3346764 RepID=UPI0036A04952
MTSRRRGRRGAGRPVVLFAALLAPAILAGGLLAGELVGYDAAVSAAGVSERQVGRQAVGGRQSGRMAVAERQSGRMAFAPVLAPAPPHADWEYEGLVPAPLRGESREFAASAVPVPEGPAEKPAEARLLERERPERQQQPVRRSGCPDEWAETWLWELCQEYQRRQA